MIADNRRHMVPTLAPWPVRGSHVAATAAADAASE